MPRVLCALPRTQHVAVRVPLSSPLSRSLTCAAYSPVYRRAASRRNFTTGHTSKNALPTIYALSSAPGRAAIAIVRVSGPACLDVYRALCPRKAEPKPRRAVVRTLYEPGLSPSQDTILDASALLLYFPGPSSATGEDILELHVHGGPAVVKAVLAAVSKCAKGIRYAEPGEFTQRAFSNGRLDLTEVEALGDALSAETEQQRRISMRANRGSLPALYEKWRNQLIYARGELEALIDFSEDQHFDESPYELYSSVAAQIEILKRHLLVHSQNAVRGEMLRNGIKISLLGAPNAGKSSLLNRVIGREAAIVSHEAGTTRDVVEVGLDLGGYLCRLGDTAGLRQPMQGAPLRSLDKDAEAISGSFINHIEQEGIRRAKERAAESDVVIVVFNFERESGSPASCPPILRLDPEVCRTAAPLVREKKNVIVILNKADLLLSGDHHSSQVDAVQATLDALPGLSAEDVHLVSCRAAEFGTATMRTKNNRGPSSISPPLPAPQPSWSSESDPGGIQCFLRALERLFARLTAAASLETADGSGKPDPSVWQESLGATERHRILLDTCIGHLQAFLARARVDASVVDREMTHPPEHDRDMDGAELDIVAGAEDLRSAADCLARITGRGAAGDVEEVLGVVFEKFCVGK